MQLSKKMPQATPIVAFDVLSCLDRLDFNHQKLLDSIQAILMTSAEHFTGPQLAACARYFARFGGQRQSLLEAISRAITIQLPPRHDGDKLSQPASKLSRCRPVYLANLAQAFAIQNVPDRALFVHIATEAVYKATQGEEWEPYHISRLLRAFAELGVDHEQLFQTFQPMLAAKIEGFDRPEGLVDTVWAYASVGRKDIELLDKCARQLGLISDQLDLTQIADVLWAYGTLQHQAPEMTAALSSKLLTMVDEIVHVDVLGDLVWALGRLKANQPELLQVLTEKAAQSIAAFGPEDLANMAWACASLGFFSPNLFQAISSKLQEPSALAALGAVAFGDLLWALTT